MGGPPSCDPDSSSRPGGLRGLDPCRQGDELFPRGGQSQEAERHGRAVETLVYLNGAVLVRMTVSWSELEARGELSDTDVRHVLELQHFDIIRKIRHGMLDGSDATPVETPTPSPPPIAAESEAFLRELLEELEL